jgi:hypothetical protein
MLEINEDIYCLMILFEMKCTIFKWQQLIDEVGDDGLI